MLQTLTKRLAASSSKRFLSSSRLVQSAHPTPTTNASNNKHLDFAEQLPGFREAGVIPTDYELAAGLERVELLKKLKGEDPWEDLHPINITKLGTVKEPIVIRGIDDERYIGCTGFPADSHVTSYVTVRPHRHNHVDRCQICGNVFKYIKEEVSHGDHH